MNKTFSQWHNDNKQDLHEEYLFRIKGLDLAGCDVFMPHQWYGGTVSSNLQPEVEDKDCQEYLFNKYLEI